MELRCKMIFIKMKKELLKVKKEQIAKKDCDWRLATNIVSIVVYFCDFSLDRVAGLLVTLKLF